MLSESFELNVSFMFSHITTLPVFPLQTVTVVSFLKRNDEPNIFRFQYYLKGT